MTSDPHAEPRRGADTVYVATPLDLIRYLEDRQGGVITVVLADRFAHDAELFQFLRETYPRLELVVERMRPEPIEPTPTALVA